MRLPPFFFKWFLRDYCNYDDCRLLSCLDKYSYKIVHEAFEESPKLLDTLIARFPMETGAVFERGRENLSRIRICRGVKRCRPKKVTLSVFKCEECNAWHASRATKMLCPSTRSMLSVPSPRVRIKAINKAKCRKLSRRDQLRYLSSVQHSEDTCRCRFV
jgi:hypothetical protein